MVCEENRLGIVDDKFTLDDIGSTLLEELAERLYQPQGVIREYIQNAVDAHRLWVAETQQQPEGPIQIVIRPNAVAVIDYGIGLDGTEIRKVKSIAVSRKRSADVKLTGHKGVGIWAGLSFFEKLTLESTKKGSDKAYVLTLHFKRIKDAISEDADIGTVLNPNYSIEEYSANADDHYTNVTLFKPVIARDQFLDPNFIKDTVRRVCPCKFDPTFVFAKEIETWYKDKQFDLYEISVDGDPISRSFPSDLEGLVCETITIDDKAVALYWRAIHKTNGVLAPQPGQLTAFRVYQNGFALKENVYSDDELPGHETISTQDYLKWYVGEIHLTHPELRPNLKRDELEESELTRQFVKRIRTFYKDAQSDARKVQNQRNMQRNYDAWSAELDGFSLAGNANKLSRPDEDRINSIRADLLKHESRVSNYKSKKADTESADIQVLRTLKGSRKILLQKIDGILKKQPNPDLHRGQEASKSSGSVSPSDGRKPPNGAAPSLRAIPSEPGHVDDVADLGADPLGNGEDDGKKGVASGVVRLDVVLAVVENVLQKIIPRDTLVTSILVAIKQRLARLVADE